MTTPLSLYLLVPMNICWSLCLSLATKWKHWELHHHLQEIFNLSSCIILFPLPSIDELLVMVRESIDLSFYFLSKASVKKDQFSSSLFYFAASAQKLHGGSYFILPFFHGPVTSYFRLPNISNLTIETLALLINWPCHVQI